MKKTVGIALVGIAMLANGCTSGSSTGTSASGGAAAPKNNNVALVLGVKGSPFYEAMACGAQAKAKELGLTLTVSAGAQFAADAQIPVVNAVTASKPAVAAVVPTDASALQQPLTALTKGGTALITVDQTVADSSIVKNQILTDNLKGGQLAADEMNTILAGKGKVLVITQPPGSTAQDERTKGFEDQLKKYSGITYLGPQYQADDPQKAAQIVTSTMAAHPDLTGVFSTNDQGAIGALTGLKQANASGKVQLIAYDAASAEVAALKNGTISALWPIHSTGVAAVLVGPRAGVHYPGSTGGLQAWFRTDSDRVEPPSTRGYPPSLERPPAGRPSRASDQHYSC